MFMDAFVLFLSTRSGSLRGGESLRRKGCLCVEEACGKLSRLAPPPCLAASAFWA